MANTRKKRKTIKGGGKKNNPIPKITKVACLSSFVRDRTIAGSFRFPAFRDSWLRTGTHLPPLHR